MNTSALTYADTPEIPGNSVSVSAGLNNGDLNNKNQDIKDRDIKDCDKKTSSPSNIITDLEKKCFEKFMTTYSDNSKYLYQKSIVSGGMGSVLKVMDQNLKRPSAMKVMLPSLRNDKANLNNFIGEAKITGLLEHPNIIPVHDLGLSPDKGIFFTMKLAQGEPLINILKNMKSGNLEYLKKYDFFYLLDVFIKVCNAVSFAHSKNIIHQDIKPHNIMIGPYGEVLLMDWGIGRFIGDPEKEQDPSKREILAEIQSLSKETKGKIIGTPSYMAPEQIRGNPALVDKSTDIFLLGATLYHIATLDYPYHGKDSYETLCKAARGKPKPPEERNPERKIPFELSAIIKKAMSIWKEERYQSVEELINDIEDLISGRWFQYEKKIFDRGSLLIKENETGEEAYMILSGKVRVFKEVNNQKIDLGMFEKGDIIGEMALMNNEKRSANVEALEKTQVAVLNREILRLNLKNMPPYMEKILLSASDRLRYANNRIHPNHNKDCTYLILKHLRLLYSDPAREKGHLPLKSTVKEIAEDLGLSGKKIIKALSRAVKVKLIICKNNKIMIPDMDELIDFTELSRIWT